MNKLVFEIERIYAGGLMYGAKPIRHKAMK